jgi:hypothetical protein
MSAGAAVLSGGSLRRGFALILDRYIHNLHQEQLMRNFEVLTSGRGLSVLALMGIAGGILPACEANTDPNPLGEIILSGKKDVVTKVVGSNHTVAFGAYDLAPVSLDPAGTEDTLSFVPTSPVASYRQEVIAFDMDLSSPITSPDPLVDFVPVAFNSFVVPANAKMKYTFPGSSTTAHIIRYWNGLCAARQPWGPIFDQISQGLLDQIVAGAKAVGGVTSATRDSDTFQVMLNSETTEIQHGFYFEGQYHVNLGPIPWNNFTVNPAYLVKERASDGLVSVTNIRRAVIPLDPKTQAVDDGLKNDLGPQVEQGIASQMTRSLANDTLTLNCDPTSDMAKQRDVCFSQITDGGSNSFAFALFSKALLAAGMTGPIVTTTAMSMLGGLEPRNFSCPTPSAGAAAQCAFHPIVKRANVMPDALELVFATDVPTTQMEKDEQTLYLNFPAVVEFLKPGAGASVHFCNQAVEVAGAPVAVPMFFHDTQTIKF